MNAQIIKLNETYNFLKIQNFLKPNELEEVWDEINFLSYKRKLNDETETARDNFGQLKSNKLGVFLDVVYRKRNFSNYFKYYKKWLNEESRKNLESSGLVWRELKHTTQDTTLFSYYEDKTFYLEHEDSARLTQLFWTFKQPKKFSGGQLIFKDFNYTIEIEDNTMILFPSWFAHEVTPITLLEKTSENSDKFLCNGRYVFSTFYF